jgi:V8-like Glu-specific endopeptidase
MHRTARHLTTFAVAAAGVLLPVTTAQGATVPDPRPVLHAAADTRAEQIDVKTYWTAARMRAAKALQVPAMTARRFASTDSIITAPRAKPVAVSPTLVADGLESTAAAASARSNGTAWTGAGAVVKTAGRVFFTITSGGDAGRNASCSGNAVTSSNKSVVITAGHCVKLGGSFHSNWVFVPGYDQGARPYGTWPATTLLTTQQWNSNEDMNFDMAAAVVSQVNGQSLTDVVGGQGVAFNQSRGRQMYSFGYPAGPPYDGSKLIYCSGRAFDDFLLSEDHGLTCNLTGGSSGGPWFINFNESTGAGLVNSVNSFKYNFAPFWMFGPYFGPEAQAVYNAAQTTALP